MALRSRRDSAMIWPGFVDAVTTLLMVMMFVLTIFTVMQVVLRDTITTQSNELDELTGQIAQLADALGLERAKVSDLQGQVGSLTSSLAAAEAEGARQQLVGYGLLDFLHLFAPGLVAFAFFNFECTGLGELVDHGGR